MAKKLPFNPRNLTPEMRRKWLLALQREAAARKLPMAEATEAKKESSVPWTPDPEGFFPASDGRPYRPSKKYMDWVRSDARFLAAFGGRGAGKTVLGAQKAMRKIMAGESGIVVAPDFEHFRNSTWVELKRWIPWHKVHKSSQYRRLPTWQPKQSFTITFVNGATMTCKGLKDPDSARGPNVNWFWYDEGGRDVNGDGWKLGIAGVRVGKNPQAWLTTTPNGKSHWSYKTFVDRRNLSDDIKKYLADIGSDVDSLFYWERFTIHDNKDNLDPLYYISMVESYGTGWFAQQELEGEFVDPGARLTERKWLEDNIVDFAPEKAVYRTRFWDLAASEKKSAKDDPDYTVGTLMSWYRGRFYIEDQVSVQARWSDVKELIVATAHADGFDVPIRIEQEPGASGKAIIEEFVTLEALAGYDIQGIKSSKDKVVRANPWISQAAANNVKTVRAEWNHDLFDQFEGFPGFKKDDKMDSVSGCYASIRGQVPVHDLPQYTDDNPPSGFGGIAVINRGEIPVRESDRPRSRFTQFGHLERWR